MTNRTGKLLIVLGFIAAFAGGLVVGKKEEQSMTAIKVQEAIGSTTFDKQEIWHKGYMEGRADTEVQGKKDVEDAMEALKKNLVCKKTQIIIRDQFAPWPFPNQYPGTKS